MNEKTQQQNASTNGPDLPILLQSQPIEPEDQVPSSALFYGRPHRLHSERHVRMTPSYSRLVSLAIQSATIDTRAVGVRTVTIGSSASGMEGLAEVLVNTGTVLPFAQILMDQNVLTRILKEIWPQTDRTMIRRNQAVMTFPMLVERIESVLSKGLPESFATAVNADDTRIFSQLLAQLFMDVLSPLNLVLPFEGAIILEEYVNPFPSFETLERSYQIGTLTTILDIIKLGQDIGKMTAISAAALSGVIAPAFLRAANMMLRAIEGDVAFRDSFALLKLFLTQDPMFPKTLLGNEDLFTMASNLTFVRLAVGLTPQMTVITRPEYILAQDLQNVVLALAKSPRTKTISLRELKEMFSHKLIWSPDGQKLSGMVFTKNLVNETKAQVGLYSRSGRDEAPWWMQTPFPSVENQLDTLLAPLVSSLTSSTLLDQIAGVAAYREQDPRHPYVIFTGTADEDDLAHYAAAFSGSLSLAALDGTKWEILYQMPDKPINYFAQSKIFGEDHFTVDPAEAILLTGEADFVGATDFGYKVQGIAPADRNKVLLTRPKSFSSRLTSELLFQIVVPAADVGADSMTASFSMATLLGLAKTIPLRFTLPLAQMLTLNAYVSTILDQIDLVLASEVSDSIRTTGITRGAFALNDLLLKIYGTAAGKQLSRAFAARFAVLIDTFLAEKTRGKLQSAPMNIRLQIGASMFVLVALGYLDERQQERINEIFDRVGLADYLVGSQAASIIDFTF